MVKLVTILLVAILLLGPAWSKASVSSIRSKIAQVANNKVGSTHWSYASSCCHGANTNKCNYFVYDVGKEAGAKMPTRYFGFGGPVGAGAGGWGKASSLNYWSKVSSRQAGDIVAGHKSGTYHVGIYVGSNMVVSANSQNIGKNANMFTQGYQDLVYWRYQG
ncbi:uncharacterized protein LOC110243258 [Exaiptasia diaphana]|uniref:NlpC/P60 domain-containing protein n=1 Tax=Exaiptasia diaphana TaxID=2652724 RepID=A0A913XIU1_EXADI|nr:uncharacterized protein LOC110243258 [Exaiptasia diaphana]